LVAVVTDYLDRLGELAVLEGDAELRGRYVPDYMPLRRHYPRGNLARGTRSNAEPAAAAGELDRSAREACGRKVSLLGTRSHRPRVRWDRLGAPA
jgi:hypothetical protein